MVVVPAAVELPPPVRVFTLVEFVGFWVLVYFCRTDNLLIFY